LWLKFISILRLHFVCDSAERVVWICTPWVQKGSESMTVPGFFIAFG
jgi:hypothetical protein